MVMYDCRGTIRITRAEFNGWLANHLPYAESATFLRFARPHLNAEEDMIEVEYAAGTEDPAAWPTIEQPWWMRETK
jgi:hypothetical protein